MAGAWKRHTNIWVNMFFLIIFSLLHKVRGKEIGAKVLNGYLELSSQHTVSVLGRDKGYTVKYSSPSEGSPEAGGLYLTVYPEWSHNRGQYIFVRIINRCVRLLLCS